MLMDILRDFGVNATLFYQIASFLLFLVCMNFVLFRPIRKIISDRNAETASLEESIEGLKGRSDEKEKSIEDGRVEARKSGYSEKEALKGEGLERMADLVGTYFGLGGHHIQFNVVTAQTLRRAQREPGRHP